MCHSKCCAPDSAALLICHVVCMFAMTSDHSDCCALVHTLTLLPCASAIVIRMCQTYVVSVCVSYVFIRMCYPYVLSYVLSVCVPRRVMTQSAAHWCALALLPHWLVYLRYQLPQVSVCKVSVSEACVLRRSELARYITAHIISFETHACWRDVHECASTGAWALAHAQS